MPILQNARHERFAQEIAAGKTVEIAYAAAGFQPDARRANPYRLRKRDDIGQRVDELLTARACTDAIATERAIEKTSITKARVAEELGRIGFARLGGPAEDTDLDFSQLTRAQIAAAQVKRAALMDIARLFGYVVERKEQRIVDEFAGVSTEDLARYVAGEIDLPTRH